MIISGDLGVPGRGDAEAPPDGRREGQATATRQAALTPIPQLGPLAASATKGGGAQFLPGYRAGLPHGKTGRALQILQASAVDRYRRTLSAYRVQSRPDSGTVNTSPRKDRVITPGNDKTLGRNTHH